MEPKGVRVACPECTWSVVVTDEIAASGGLPPGVNRKEHDSFLCPNCNVPMVPVASVDTTERPRIPDPDTMTEAERLAKILDAQHDVEQSAKAYEGAKSRASSLRKEWEGKVETLGAIIKRLAGVVVPGEPAPLLALAEAEPEPAACDALHPSEALRCTLPAGHVGNHRRTAPALDDVGDVPDETLAEWEQTPVEQAAAMAGPEHVERARVLPHRGRRRAEPETVGQA